MPIRPFDITNKAPLVPDELNDILRANNLSGDPTKEDQGKKLNINNARKVFNSAGADLESAARTVSNVMQRGETDAGRLKASELVLKVHGILQDLDDNHVPQINITISGSDNKTLINLVLPSN